MTKALASVTVIRGNGECKAIVNGLVNKELERQAAMHRAEREKAAEDILFLEAELHHARKLAASAMQLYKHEMSENGKNAHARLLAMQKKKRRREAEKAAYAVYQKICYGVGFVAVKIGEFVTAPLWLLIDSGKAFVEFHKHDDVWAVVEGLEVKH